MEYVYCIFICIHRVDSNVIIAIIVHMHPGIYYIWTTDFNHYYMHACKICAGTAVPMQKHRTYICWIQQQDAKHKPLQKNHASIAISVNFYDLWDCKLQTIICDAMLQLVPSQRSVVPCQISATRAHPEWALFRAWPRTEPFLVFNVQLQDVLSFCFLAACR